MKNGNLKLKMGKIKNLQKINADGFSLIEMLVAVSVFTIVMSMAMTAFINISSVQKKTSAFRAVNDNLNFAMESMAREIRTGKDYNLSGGVFSFTNANDCVTKFTLQGNKITKEIVTNNPPTCVQTSALDMTSGNAKVMKLDFVVRGEAVNDDKQPIVLIIMNGESGEKLKEKSFLNIQTAVSQRLPDS